MASSAELSSFDLRYDTYRRKAPALEARLLASIVERGIQQPLKGVDVPQGRRLSDGFKRCRCAEKLHIECVPYVSLGEEEATGIIDGTRRALAGAARAVVLAAPDVRRYMRKLIEVDFPGVAVLTYAELAEDLAIRPIGKVAFGR